jgi:hypothetical protein
VKEASPAAGGEQSDEPNLTNRQRMSISLKKSPIAQEPKKEEDVEA